MSGQLKGLGHFNYGIKTRGNRSGHGTISKAFKTGKPFPNTQSHLLSMHFYHIRFQMGQLIFWFIKTFDKV
jgi:hypothetical protein